MTDLSPETLRAHWQLVGTIRRWVNRYSDESNDMPLVTLALEQVNYEFFTEPCPPRTALLYIAQGETILLAGPKGPLGGWGKLRICTKEKIFRLRKDQTLHLVVRAHKRYKRW